jgi:coenzyme F420 hydrogenase subunit beta
MQDLGVTPSENIEVCLGLFCYENFLFDKAKIERFEKDFNIKFADVKKVNIKQDLFFKLRDVETGEKTVHIPFNHLDNYMRPACNACNDFTNILADISFGGLGSKEKFTTVIPRTDKGNEIFSKVNNAGLIKCSSLDETNKNEMLKILSQFSLMKNKRKENYLENIM